MRVMYSTSTSDATLFRSSTWQQQQQRQQQQRTHASTMHHEKQHISTHQAKVFAEQHLCQSLCWCLDDIAAHQLTCTAFIRIAAPCPAHLLPVHALASEVRLDFYFFILFYLNLLLYFNFIILS
jgi:hypothetical protein